MAAVRPAVSGELIRSSSPSMAPFAIPTRTALDLPAKLRWQLAGWYRETGKVAEWQSLLDEMASSGDDTIRLLEERARLAYTTGDMRTAERVLTERRNRAPSATASIALGRFYLGSGEIEKAFRISRELLQARPDLLTVLQLAAEVAHANGDTAAEKEIYERTLAERPDHAGTLLGLARLEVDAGHPQRAASLAQEAVGPDQEWTTAKQLREAARVLIAAGQPELAEALHHRASQQDAARTSTLFTEIADALGIDDDDSRPLDRECSDVIRKPEIQEDREPEVPGREPVETSESTSDPDLDALHPGTLAKLDELFGFPSLRPGQAAVIANVLDRCDTLATMPTGAGKSLTFQLPAMLLKGATLVISPLIALMKDQVDSLPAAVRARTVLVNSSLSADEQRQALDAIASGQAKLIYAAPERLRQHAFLRALHDANVELLVIDEAHCISLWGHDFRPDYLTIPAVLPVLGEPTVLAITATATPEMAVAIGSGLGRDLDRVRASLFRANLHYEAHRCANREDKLAKVVSISRKERGAGIVYVGSRRDADAIAALLRDRGISAVSYHAGLDPETRARAQERFMSGNARVVVATVAFGMGVDKADVRFIIHLSPPRSLEAYAQESGRAGRDGRPARCVLLYSAADKAQLNRLARLDQLSLSVLRDVYRALQQTAVWRWAIVDATKLLPPAGMDEDRPDPRIALGILEQAGLIRQHPDAPVFRVVSLAPRDPGEVEETRDSTWQRFRAWVGVDDSGAHERFETAQACQALDMSPAEINTLLAGQPDLIVRDGPRLTCIELLPSGPDARQRIEAVLDRSRQAASRRIDQVMRYAAGRACRHRVLAAHLGERLDPCRTVCDVCLGNRSLLEHDAHSVEASPSTPARSSTTAADALAVLQAVRTLPFNVGKTGLVRLLLGSVESRIRADRSPSFGCLSDVKKARVEALVDRLIEGAFLHRDLDHEYKLISLTPRGASASLDDLAAYGPDALQREDPRSASVDQALLERLTAWRRQRSADDQVPPYVVAHNAMLEEIARARPRSRAELQHIPGFGPKRIDLYGDAILAAVDGDSG